MTRKTRPPTPISDDDLDKAEGGGVFQTPAGGWGQKAGTWTDMDVHDPGYVGETENRLSKTPKT